MILSYLWHPEKNSNQIDEFPLKQKVAYDRMTKAAHLACVSWKACVIFKCGQERSLLWEPVTCRRTDSHRSCFWEARDLGVPANIKGRETEAAFESVCLKVNVLSCSVMLDSLWPHGLQPTKFFCPWNSAGKNTGVGSHSLLQGIFLTQGSNACLLHCRQILYCLNHKGSSKQPSHFFLEALIKPTAAPRPLSMKCPHPQHSSSAWKTVPPLLTCS